MNKSDGNVKKIFCKNMLLFFASYLEVLHGDISKNDCTTMQLDDKEKFYAVLKSLVVKSLVDISSAKGIIPGLDVQYSSAKNTNCFNLTWDYEDSDGIRLYTTDLIDSTVYDNVSLNIYAGWNESKNVSSLRLLKKYNLNYSEIKQKIIEIPITDIRSLLTDSDYEGGIYAGADLSFELIIKTKKYGIFKEVLPWGLTK